MFTDRSQPITLRFSFLPPTLNKLLNTNRANKFEAANEKAKFTAIAARQSYKYKNYLLPDEGKVFIAVHYNVMSVLNDPDNIQTCKKAILDGIVQSKVIPDDSFKYVQPYIFESFTVLKSRKRKDEIGMEVFICKDYNDYSKYISEKFKDCDLDR